MASRRRPLVAVVAVLGVAVVALAGCGLTAPAVDPTAGAGTLQATGAAWECRGPATAVADRTQVPHLEGEPAATLPVTLTDTSGESVTVTDNSRILALDTYGTLGTTVWALGLGDHLVGRDVSTGIPELADLPVVTHNGHELNAEAILDLAPTVVLTDYSIGPLEVQLQLRDSGIPVVILDSRRSRATVVPQIEEVARALGVPAAGEQLGVLVGDGIAEAEAEVAAMAPADPGTRPRMAFLYVRGSAGVYYWFGEGSGADDLIDALGGIDVASATGLKGEQPLTAEGLVKADPSLYLMMTHGLDSVGGVEGVEEIPGVADTTAGQTRCVVDMSDSEVLSFGPQFPGTLRALAAAIYGPSQ